jgi:sterol desaturase/sphingolipid hydroxylase (fatty acid hydroxylase superfamily)
MLDLGSQTYATVYFGAILAVALAEVIAPARAAGPEVGRRWLRNFGLTLLGTAIVRIVYPLVGVGWAVFVAERGWGLLPQTRLPLWVTMVTTVVVLDFSYYLQHYLLHAVPTLWRLHRTHHSDVEYDFSTGVRFHPFEALFTNAFGMAFIALLGAPPEGVMLSQIIAVAVAFTEHANVCIPPRIDRVVRVVFVTPNMHRVHHSVERDEGNSNFSSTLSIWDRVFGTYIDQPAAGHERMQFGLKGVRDREQLTLPRLLVQPFADLSAAGQAPSASRPPGATVEPVSVVRATSADHL